MRMGGNVIQIDINSTGHGGMEGFEWESYIVSCFATVYEAQSTIKHEPKMAWGLNSRIVRRIRIDVND